MSFLRPDGDNSVGSWRDEGAATTNLYQSIDEVTASDTDYAESSDNPSSDTWVITLSNPVADVNIDADVDIDYRIGLDAAGSINASFVLKDGATEIATWSVEGVPASATTYQRTLTPGEKAAVSDWDNLTLEITANVAAGQFALPASTVLAYSTARAFDGYSGSLIRVERSSDGTEADIGTDANGDLDEAALLAHVGTGGTDQGYVVRWYEQSGATDAVDMTPDPGRGPPLIVENGAVVKVNGKPSIKTLTNEVITTEAQVWSTRPSDAVAIVVCQFLSPQRLGLGWCTISSYTASNHYAGFLDTGNTTTVLSQGAGEPTNHYKNGSLVAVSGTDNRDDMYVAFVDEGLLINRIDSLDLSDIDFNSIGPGYGGSADPPNNYSEFIIMDSPSAGDVSDVEDSQTAYYSIT